MNSNKKGFTLIELISVLILLIVIVIIATLNFMPTFEDSKKQALVDEALVISEGVLNKYADDRLSKTFYSDVFASRNSTKRCYSVKSLFGTYVQKGNAKKYSGSIEICTADNCEYKTKIWLSNGDYYINGSIVDENLNHNYVSDVKDTQYFNSCGVDISNIDYEWLFDYSGSEETLTIPKDGTYALETWGAQGGNSYYVGIEPGFYGFVRWTNTGGFGGYSYTEVDLKQGDTLYVRVGGKGGYNLHQKDAVGPGGFNGGGKANYHVAGGGGATSVALKSGALSQVNINDVLVVAGGGGGSAGTYMDDADSAFDGGSGGGYCGNNYWGGAAACTGSGVYGKNDGLGAGGGLYTTGGASLNYDFIPRSVAGISYWRPGYNFERSIATAGGAGYIGNPITRNGLMASYNTRSTYDGEFDKTINISNSSEDPIKQYAKEGNGYAKITYLGTENSNPDGYKYNASYYAYTVPTTGVYKIELWGAQGGSIDGVEGGLGAYTSGNISLTAGEKLYFYVGSQGTLGKAGYNGGAVGGSNNEHLGGGGATDVRYFSSTPTEDDLKWNSFNGLKSRIMVAAGGASSAHFGATHGDAGGLTGYAGNYTGWGCDISSDPTPATQTSPGKTFNNSSSNSGFGYAGYGTIAGCYVNVNTSGGGGGYYGGASATAHGYSCVYAGTGGSSYISGYAGCNSISGTSTSDNIVHTGSPNHYSGKVFTNSVMIDGRGRSWEGGSASSSLTGFNSPYDIHEYGHKGDGFARITFVE